MSKKKRYRRIKMKFRIDRDSLAPYEEQEEVEFETIGELLDFLKANGESGHINLFEGEDPQIEIYTE
jgi:hypothetical protein